jgi:hypothetical protein
MEIAGSAAGAAFAFAASLAFAVFLPFFLLFGILSKVTVVLKNNVDRGRGTGADVDSGRGWR